MVGGVNGVSWFVTRLEEKGRELDSVTILLLFMEGILVLVVVWIWIFVQVGGSMILKHSFDIEI
jgi:hypothetical protein